MTLIRETRQDIIKKHRRHDKDTASPEVQIAVLSARLDYLNDHFKTHKKDHHSKLGLMKVVNRRRKLLDYLCRSNRESYRSLIADLGIRK